MESGPGGRIVAPTTAVLRVADADTSRLEAAVTAVLRLQHLAARRGRDGSVLYLRQGRPVVRAVARLDDEGATIDITSRVRSVDPLDTGIRAAVALGLDVERLDVDHAVLRPPLEVAGWVRRRPPAPGPAHR